MGKTEIIAALALALASGVLTSVPACGGGESADTGVDVGFDGGAKPPIEAYADGGWEYYGSGCDVWGVGIKVNTRDQLYCEGMSSSEKSANLVWREIHPGYGLNGIIPSGACCQKGGDTVTGVFACEYFGTGYVSTHRRELLDGVADPVKLLCNIRSVHECEVR